MCRICGHVQFASEIEDLLDDPSYRWAEETLRGILATVRRTQHATERQAEAVENIREGGSR